ncbi:hypothetical protein COOONC_12125 [Cooperia oncophora]
MDRCSIILLVLLLYSTDAYKFLVYSPIFAYSHTNFMGAIADTLTEAGHDVTVLMPVLDKELEHFTGLKLTTKIIKTPTDPRVEERMKYKSVMFANMWTMQSSIFRLMQVRETNIVHKSKEREFFPFL